MGRGEGAGDIECMLAGEGASEGFGPKGTGLNPPLRNSHV